MLLSLQGRPPLSINSCLEWFPSLASSQGGYPSPSQEFPLGKLRLFSGWRESNERSLPGQENRKPWKHSEKPGGVRSVPRAMPMASAMRAEGRERESHISLRQPCCAADPYVPTPVSITGREGGRGSAQRRVRLRGRGLVPSSLTLPRSGATKPLPLFHPRPHAWPGKELRSF